MAVTFKCDICGHADTDQNQFTKITIQKFPSKPLVTFLCEEKCFRLFRLFWKQQEKNIVENNGNLEISDN